MHAAAPMHLYDSARGEVAEFTPGETVSMYVCGITPYDATHLGHAATYVTYDIVQRRLLDRGHEVRYVRNITDVDDDILRAARRRGVHYLDLAFGETARFDDDMAALNTLAPWSEPRATGAISNIRGLIDTLLTQGDAYLVDGAVYFDTEVATDFGSLARLGDERMRELAGEWGERPDDPAKRNPLDFVLWRPSDDGEPAW
ncbi:MAG: cysteine--tRNA ligase, partial [Actinomycetota bacterium]